MPNKTTKKKTKATSPKKAQAKKTQTKKTPAKSSAKAEQMKLQERKAERQSFFVTQVLPYILIVAAIFLVVCYFTGGGEDPGVVNGFIYNALTGLFSGAAFILPLFLIVSAIMSLTDKTDASAAMRYTFAGISMLLLAALLQLITPAGSFSVVTLFKNGTELSGGGVIGGLIGELFLVCFKAAGSYVLIIAFLLLSVLLMIGLTPKYIYVYIAYTIKTKRDEAAQRKAEAMLDGPLHFRDPDAIAEAYEAKQAEKAKAKEEKAETTTSRRKPKFDTDVPVEIDIPEDVLPAPETAPEPEPEPVDMDTAIFNEVLERTRSKKSAAEIEAEKAFFEGAEKPAAPEAVAAEPKVEEIKAETSGVSADSAAILDQLADAYLGRGNGEAESLSVERSDEGEIVSVEQVAIEIPKPEYKFPPIDLLTEDKGSKAGDIRGELHDNAAKLVRVLGSFNVKTKIVGVSRGPTITRYELLPEAGTRVRSIANLVDDIALNLATTGVRIEAPIPGKAAVGIEVPNKVAETVYLRSLIDTKEFSENASKISTALGKNVGGEPVFMDIKKMPHLLIAGATGMGKSVCINCLLVSMLYKASPDEVKLMLIDPKKVEFNIYNGLPHLLVPVVSDPKKAAGSLNWAVNEMERRFGLIEAVGVRDIASYNEITKNDPDYEYMPQIVIVIDELADLMSTAPDDVETSIARLAAKARAAGMHLIIGTQRPSVDVITGVIKANIPSRIACTVASQVDSRTIIDRSGAENLIGRGDMLYSPVGASKPMRVQGAFISDKEVDDVVSFIKAQNLSSEDNKGDEIMKEIEAAAAMCGSKKGSGGATEGGGADGDGDPLLRQALDVAFESGKVSTSLLQRRLSIGYGRAAKIIDRLEELGYVSAPEGQKPRQLLITKQEYMEMVLRDEDPS
ncbi:MAG: DNA translocase FtsK [Clostridia bacterium]|nr:DNA translocase FtsK [Clostridia bacterium]